MHFACAFPVLLIFGLLAYCIVAKQHKLVRPLDKKFKLIRQPNQKGYTKVEYLLMTLAVIFFILGVAPEIVLILLGASNDLWSAMHGVQDGIQLGENSLPLPGWIFIVFSLICLGALGLIQEDEKIK